MQLYFSAKCCGVSTTARQKTITLTGSNEEEIIYPPLVAVAPVAAGPRPYCHAGPLASEAGAQVANCCTLLLGWAGQRSSGACPCGSGGGGGGGGGGSAAPATPAPLPLISYNGISSTGRLRPVALRWLNSELGSGPCSQCCSLHAEGPRNSVQRRTNWLAARSPGKVWSSSHAAARCRCH